MSGLGGKVSYICGWAGDFVHRTAAGRGACLYGPPDATGILPHCAGSHPIYMDGRCDCVRTSDGGRARGLPNMRGALVACALSPDATRTHTLCTRLIPHTRPTAMSTLCLRSAHPPGCTLAQRLLCRLYVRRAVLARGTLRKQALNACAEIARRRSRPSA